MEGRGCLVWEEGKKKVRNRKNNVVLGRKIFSIIGKTNFCPLETKQRNRKNHFSKESYSFQVPT